MRTEVVITLTGPDRVGIVEEVTQAVLNLDGNVESSRMARLGGEFAILMLVTMQSERIEELEGAFTHLTDDGYRMNAGMTEDARAAAGPDWPRYRIDVRGADHEGIIHEVARGLKGAGISVESMETGTVSAPVSGTPLFTMNAIVAVPPGLDAAAWRGELEQAAQASNVDISVSETETV
jgi:glycine cleavage system transcriptional repressor